MSSEYRGQSPDPNASGGQHLVRGQGERSRPTSELWGDQWGGDAGRSIDEEEDTQPHPVVKAPPTTLPPGIQGQQQVPSQWQQSPQPQQPQQSQSWQQGQEQDDLRQFSHREHVTGALSVYPSEAPLFRPAYLPPQSVQGAQWVAPPGQAPGQPGYPPVPQQPQKGYPAYPPYGQQGMPPYAGHSGYQGYPGYPGYPPPYGGYPGYPGYAYPPYGWQPVQQPKDGYRLTVVIMALVGSGLAMLGGLASIGLAILIYVGASINPNVRGISPDQLFSSILTFTAFAIAGLIGGSFSLYHSIRGLLRKPSASFVLPWFWIFLALYLLVLGIGYALQVNGQAVTMPALTIFLIILAALFPALTLLSLGVRRLRFVSGQGKRMPEWTTNWRRFTLALTSGATLGIGLALILELALLFLIVRSQNAANFSQCIDNPTAPGCGSFTTFNLIFIVVAIMGPIVEETVKPLGVALFIGKMRSAAEAFVLGLGAGVGFALVETMGYIGSGYQDWLTVALERTGASLLHGFGTAMVALGWYYFTHAKKQRFLKGIGLWVYAVFQHMVWNGTAVIALIPGPVGTTINNWNLNLGFTSLPFTEILNIIEAILILVFFIYMTGRLRKQKPVPPTNGEERKGEVRQVGQVGQTVAGR